MSAEESCDDFNSSHSGHLEIYTNGFSPCLALVVVAALGMVGNILAFFLTTTKKFNLLSFSVYIRALTIADSLALLFTAAPYLLEWIYRESLQVVFGLAGFLCLHFMAQSAQTVSSWLMVAISVDRFIVVVFPLKRAQMCTRKRAKWTSIGVVVACCLFIGAEILTHTVHPKICLSDFSEISEFSAMTKMRRLVLTLIVPGLVTIGLNVKVLLVLRQMTSFRKQLAAHRTNQSGGHGSHLRITRALMCVSVMSTILFIPVIILDILDAVYLEDHLHGNSTMDQAVVDQWCIAELLYITDISLHFYTLIAIIYGYRDKALTAVTLLKLRLVGATPSSSPALNKKCYNVHLKTLKNCKPETASPRYKRKCSHI